MPFVERQALLEIGISSQNMSELCNDIDANHNSKAKHCVQWWSRDRILRMLCKAFTLRDSEDWNSAPNTSNPVESLNREAVHQRGVQRRLCVTLTYVAWRQTSFVAREENINPSYETRSQKADSNKRRKTKLTSWIKIECHLALLDKRAKLMRREKKKNREGFDQPFC